MNQGEVTLACRAAVLLAAKLPPAGHAMGTPCRKLSGDGSSRLPQDPTEVLMKWVHVNPRLYCLPNPGLTTTEAFDRGSMTSLMAIYAESN